jgi:hypothetical protein
LIAPGISLILAGITASFAALSGLIIETNWTKGLVGSPNLGDEMIGAVVPPVIQSVLMIWLLLASVIVILGVVLLFFKKPYNNKGNKKK